MFLISKLFVAACQCLGPVQLATGSSSAGLAEPDCLNVDGIALSRINDHNVCSSVLTNDATEGNVLYTPSNVAEQEQQNSFPAQGSNVNIAGGHPNTAQQHVSVQWLYSDI